MKRAFLLWLPIVTAVGFAGGLRADEKAYPDRVRQDVETFEAAYALSEGEVLARLIPPFIPERLVYYRVKHAGQAQAIPQGPDSMLFRWEKGTLAGTGMSFSNGQGIQVRALVRMLADVFPQEVEGDQQTLDTQISGDFVLRSGESREHIVESLEAILRDEPKLPVRLRFRDVKRQVYVLRGEYKFTPLPDYPDSIQIYGDKLAANSGAGGGGGDFTDFTRWVGMWIERPVLGEVKNGPKNLSWRYHMAPAFTPEQRAAAKEPRAVLRNLAGQTGLTFEEETREIRLLFVERDG
ncbi:MAG TPA: hypothetical protein VG125_21415 [Pirellulales bacterium]|nr:hypothetical protein [Pirellulales bacterium]